MASITESVRDYLISKGMDPEEAQRAAERGERRRDVQALTTANVPLSVILGGAGKGLSYLADTRLGQALLRAGEAGQPAKAISPNELAIIQGKNPGRLINPQTGTPMSIAGKPAMSEAAAVDPYEALLSRAKELVSSAPQRTREAAASAKSFLTEPKPIVNPETGYALRNVPAAKGAPLPRPDLPFGTTLTGFTPAQQAARVALPTAGAAGVGYLGLSGAERRRADEAAAVQGQELAAQQAAAADQSTYRGMDSASPAGGEERLPEAMPIPPRVSDLIARAQAAAPRRAAPSVAAAPTAAPAPQQEDGGILSKIFGGAPSGNMSREELMRRANESGSAADFFRADEALRKERPEMFPTDGMATGGAAKPHKDAALHKALEIIHALIARR